MSFLNEIDATKIVCASKYFNPSEMKRVYALGIKHFGENRVEDLVTKKQELHELDITYHFIGHLQRNKTKQVINEISYLHSLDSLLLAKEIQKYRNEVLNCFIQVNLTDETQKNGIFSQDLGQFLLELEKYDKIKVIGLMTIGKDGDSIKTRHAFETLQSLKTQYGLKYLSIGMSNDYKIALEYEPKFIRIGSLFKGVI